MSKSYQLIDAGCEFWFNDNDRMRTPFPKRIQEELKERTTKEFMRWVRDFSRADRETVQDEELVSMFEMFLFSEALKIVEAEEDSGDLMITINYPLLPRVGDTMSDDTHKSSTIVRRELAERSDKDENGDDKKSLWLTLHLTEEGSGEEWTTSSELPT